MAENLISFNEEGQTPLDDLSGLRVDVKTRQELNDLEARNNTQAYAQYLLFIKSGSQSNPFTHELLCQIHKDMFGDVWSWAGKKRKTEKNIGVQPVKVGFEINRLLYDLNHWEEKKIDLSEIAVKLHHRLAYIHPFENGNGRWARLVTNIYLHRKRLPLLRWPTDEGDIKKNFRQKYLSALRSADNGDYEPLLKIHAEIS